MLRSSVPRMMFSSMVSSAVRSAPDRSSMVLTGSAGGRHDQVAGCQASARGRAILGHLVDEQAFDVGKADGASQPPGHLAGSDRDAKLRRPDRFSAGERVDPAAQCLVGGYGQVEAFTEAVRVDPEQLSGRVEDRRPRSRAAAGRCARGCR